MTDRSIRTVCATALGALFASTAIAQTSSPPPSLHAGFADREPVVEIRYPASAARGRTIIALHGWNVIPAVVKVQ